MDKGGRGVPRPHTGPKVCGAKKKGRYRVREGERMTETDKERGGRARLGYLSRGPRVPSYATEVELVQLAQTLCSSLPYSYRGE